MKVIKIKKHMWLKPRRCPQCHKFCLFARAPKAKCCPKCHKHQRDISRRAERRRKRHAGVYKYTAKYKTARKHMLEEHPYCSLCGTTENLTVHHVGGGCDHYTVLCFDCHQAYERFNHIRKAKKWKKMKRLIVGSSLWKNIMLNLRCHCLMLCYRKQLRTRALEPQEARLVVLNLPSENITN